ncbi:MAG: elongation factor Ts [Erysipelotrichaceae bacterium]|nr:elongation factor Ts [Erysipelotrichaceae bacterium]
MAITAAQVKELRERTGAGMMDCKKALTATDGDMDKAADWLREAGISKAAKKASRIAAEGLSKAVVCGNKAVVVEINSETDFVAKNDLFLDLLNNAATMIAESDAKTMEEANALVKDGKTLADMVVDATATIGEKISLRRFEVIEKSDSDVFGVYMHNGGKISVVCVLANNADPALAKSIAMQIASMNPLYVSRNDVPADVLAHETEVQTNIVKNDPKMANKPEKVIAGIIEGKVSKTFQEMCLVDQAYFLEGDKKCSQVLKENNTECISFTRYMVGEGMEKREENFAEEVAKSMNV